jgi:hypothetical protein
MSYDVKVFNVCDHLVNKIQYESRLCPRCRGEGYYFDIHFDATGAPVLATGDIKLQQEVLKILLDEKYTNPFHLNWGSDLRNLIGTKNLAINKARIELIVRNTLEYLKSVQVNEYMTSENLTADEIIDQILFVEIKALGPTGYTVDVTFSNGVKEVYNQSINI